MAQGITVLGNMMTAMAPGSKRVAEAATGIDGNGNNMSARQQAAGFVLGVAEGLGNIAGGEAAEGLALKAAERWLGNGYRELAPGVFRSADNARQFRMTASDLEHAVPHVHFESIASDGRTIVENSHVSLVP